VVTAVLENGGWGPSLSAEALWKQKRKLLLVVLVVLPVLLLLLPLLLLKLLLWLLFHLMHLLLQVEESQQDRYQLVSGGFVVGASRQSLGGALLRRLRPVYLEV